MVWSRGGKLCFCGMHLAQVQSQLEVLQRLVSLHLTTTYQPARVTNESGIPTPTSSEASRGSR